MRATVVATNNCWEAQAMERIPHVADARCPQWFEQLTHGGIAAIHSIGERIATPAQATFVQSRLVALLAESREPLAAQYLALRFHRLASMPVEQQAELLRGEHEQLATFEIITGYPVNDVPLWQSAAGPQLVTKYRPALVRAIRWWHQYGTAAADVRNTQSEARLRAWLSGEAAKAIHASLVIAARPESQLLRTAALDAMQLIINSGRSSAGERSAAQSATLALRVRR
jgi:hypothetical protein